MGEHYGAYKKNNSPFIHNQNIHLPFRSQEFLQRSDSVCVHSQFAPGNQQPWPHLLNCMRKPACRFYTSLDMSKHRVSMLASTWYSLYSAQPGFQMRTRKWYQSANGCVYQALVINWFAMQKLQDVCLIKHYFPMLLGLWTMCLREVVSHTNSPQTHCSCIKHSLTGPGKITDWSQVREHVRFALLQRRA